MVNDRPEAKTGKHESPQDQLKGLVDSLVENSGDVLVDDSGASIVGTKRLLTVARDRKLSVGRYDEMQRARMTDQWEADNNRSIGLLYGVVETYAGAPEDVALRVDYYIGETGVAAAIDARINPENPYRDGSSSLCQVAADSLGFGDHWANLTAEAEHSTIGATDYTVVELNEHQLQRLNETLRPYIEH